MIIEYIERLRMKPPAERKRFALGLSVALTAVVVLLWSTTLPAAFGFTPRSMNLNCLMSEKGIFFKSNCRIFRAKWWKLRLSPLIPS